MTVEFDDALELVLQALCNRMARAVRQGDKTSVDKIMAAISALESQWPGEVESFFRKSRPQSGA
jgi:hypothetical protein